jgi:hypothetical protein
MCDEQPISESDPRRSLPTFEMPEQTDGIQFIDTTPTRRSTLPAETSRESSPERSTPPSTSRSPKMSDTPAFQPTEPPPPPPKKKPTAKILIGLALVAVAAVIVVWVRG